MAQNKLPANPKPPVVPSRFDKLEDAREVQDRLVVWLAASFRDVNNQVNRLSEGRIVAKYNSQTATPSQTVTEYAQGDFVWNKAPTEQGTVSAKFVVIGWSCISAGSPGDWVQVRGLTGN